MMMAVLAAVFLNIQFVTSFSQTLMPPRNCIQASTSTFSTTTTSTSLYLSSSDIQSKLQEQMAKLQDRDRSSKEISSDVSNIDMCDVSSKIVMCVCWLA